MRIKALIMAGGSGTRLWPLSREMMPKQLLSLTNNRSLLQETCRRISNLIPLKDQMIITGSDYYFQIESQMKSLTDGFAHLRNFSGSVEILQEPCAKNTAPAIFWAAKRCLDTYGEDSVLLVLPSDHLITEEDAFINVLEAGIEKAKEGCLVAFGIKPTHAETGYGYIKVNNKDKGLGLSSPIIKFEEKPDELTAQRYLEDGNYLWNSGMFVFHVGKLINEGIKHCPESITPFLEGKLNSREELELAYSKVIGQSIDYAIMEKTNKAYAIPASIGWTDVGSWDSLFKVSQKDKYGNVLHGHSIAIDTKNTFIYGKQRLIATIGLEDMAIIDTPDALMISPLNQTQRVKEVVEKLKADNSQIHIEHQTVQRPWGNYTIIQEGDGYKVRRVVVMPKQSLSLQMHNYRSEHWVVVKGTARITKGNDEIILRENESATIPSGTMHRLENPYDQPLEIIETQSGDYIEEDDIFTFNEKLEVTK